MQSLKVPVEGSAVRQGIEWTKGPDGNLVAPPNLQAQMTPVERLRADEQSLAGAPGSGAPQAPAGGETAPAPARDLSLLEQLHPSLNPSQVEITWDEKTGRPRIAPRQAAQQEAVPGVIDAGAGSEDLPDLGEQHQNIPGGSAPAAAAAPVAPAAPSNEITELRAQVAGLMKLVGDMAAGRQQQQPAQPAEPDYSQVDLYDPAQLAGFIRQTMAASVRDAMAPNQQAIEYSRRQQEYNALAATRGTEAGFTNKSLAAIELVRANPSLTIEQAYNVISSITPILSPQQQQQTAPVSGATAKPPARTLTPEQAAAKAEQARRLPAQNGMRGAGPAEPPAHITGLGQRIMWHLQQASLGN